MRDQRNDNGIEIEAGDTRIKFGGRFSRVFLAQIAVVVAIIAGVFRPRWARDIFRWIAEKAQNAYIIYSEDVIEWFQDRGDDIRDGARWTGWIIRISSIIFLVIIGLAIGFYAAGQSVYAAIALLALIFLPWLLAAAINFESLSIIVAPLAAGLTWALVFVLSMIIFPVGTIGFGLRLAGLIVLALLGTAGMAAGKRGQAIPMTIAILGALFMLIYGASGWVQEKINKAQSDFAVGTAKSGREAKANYRRARAIKAYTLGEIIEEGKLRDAKDPANTLEPAVIGTKVFIEYKNGKPLASPAGFPFRGTFCKIYLEDENGSFPEADSGYWIEDTKVLDTEIEMKPIKKPKAEKPKTTYLETISASTDEATWFPGRGQKKLSKGTTFVIQSTDLAGWEWFFDNQSWARYNVNDPPVAIPDGAREIELRGAPNPELGRRRNFTVTY